jgi:hypothetical protein
VSRQGYKKHHGRKIDLRQYQKDHGDKSYIMETGEHVYFDSRIPHSGRSPGEKKAKLLVVIYFYKRNRQ